MLSGGFRGFKGFQKPGLQGFGPKIQVLSIASIVSTLSVIVTSSISSATILSSLPFSQHSFVVFLHKLLQPHAQTQGDSPIFASYFKVSTFIQWHNIALPPLQEHILSFGLSVAPKFLICHQSFKIHSEPGALPLCWHFTTPKTCYHITSQSISYHPFLQSFDHHLSTASPNLPSV